MVSVSVPGFLVWPLVVCLTSTCWLAGCWGGVGWSKHPSIIPCQHQPGPSLSPALVSGQPSDTPDTGHSRVSPCMVWSWCQCRCSSLLHPGHWSQIPRSLLFPARVADASCPAHHMIQPRLVPNNFAFYVPSVQCTVSRWLYSAPYTCTPPGRDIRPSVNIGNPDSEDVATAAPHQPHQHRALGSCHT